MTTIIVIPTYNEADNLPAMADALWALPLSTLEILVVDDASPDGTGRLADELAARTPDA
jgi:dolichol-phosphate mannosyltransferase